MIIERKSPRKKPPKDGKEGKGSRAQGMGTKKNSLNIHGEMNPPKVCEG